YPLAPNETRLVTLTDVALGLELEANGARHSAKRRVAGKDPAIDCCVGIGRIIESDCDLQVADPAHEFFVLECGPRPAHEALAAQRRPSVPPGGVSTHVIDADLQVMPARTRAKRRTA